MHSFDTPLASPAAHERSAVMVALQKLYQKVPDLEKSTAVAMEKMRLEETARRKLEERLITVRI